MGILSAVKYNVIKQFELLLKKAWGMKFLDKGQTLEYLNKYLVSPPTESHVVLPEVHDVSDNTKIIFERNTADGCRNHVWIYEPGKRSSLLPIGSVLTDNKVLQCDFGYPNLLTDDFGGSRVLADFFSPPKREEYHTETVIAPWSQYFRSEYYLYVMFVAAKLSRIRDAVPEDIFKKAIIAYPFFDTSFEPEYLELLDFKPEQVINTRKKKITFDKCILGNNDDWSYPNKTDIISLRKRIETKMQVNSNPDGRRVYISRSGRRKIVNEQALIAVLKKFDFEICEDKQRSVTEQFTIYNNASFIMGPHGASFSNIIWCRPGTHLFELFAPTYVYNFFLYLAQIMELKYSAYCNGPVIPYGPYKTVNDDITVNVDEIEKYLNKIFN